MPESNRAGFEFRGINHLALVCRNMARTVEFYQDILGMPLIKTLNLPDGKGQHFFFDAGNDTSIAFFWFPEAPEAQPGVVQASRGGGVSAHGSMNHLAIDVAPEHLELYRQRLVDAGIEVTPIVNHDDSPRTISPEVNATTFVRSIYFHDPDGIRLELAAWARPFTPEDAAAPAVDVDHREAETA
ncbi:VOC family protein [Phenylobacterium sp. SCN 70-31]|uniref:VOC family protein n=1 Tax=Phenylobacterium sp. SCN 70-31 TaxID=1660129 RepID=UPI0008698D00|nr:VOC family protein [Phenylobacterium sp. SCN 70-31]ODT89729.1 MAG: glyoxalase [Phenylobacterium sp. SCN 70-31]